MRNRAEASWTSASRAAAARPGAPELAGRAPPAAWLAPGLAARDGRGARLVAGLLRRLGRRAVVAAVWADGRASRCAAPGDPIATIRSSQIHGSFVAGWCW